MSEQEVNQTEEIVEEAQPSSPQKRSFFRRRNFFILSAGAAIVLLLVGLAVFFSYRLGYFDNYIKAQFVAKMDQIGMVFDADVLEVRVAPLRLHLKNATFNDKLSGEKLFRVGEADLTLSVKDLYAWHLSRDLSLDTTDVKDVEAWVKFDAEGKSNFSNLKLVEDEGPSRVNFTYSSLKFSLQNGVVHFGDLSRKIDANANNIVFYLEPENYEVPDDQKRYKVDFTSTESNLIYDGKPIEPVNVRARGIVDNNGAEISEIKLTTPLGEAALNGSLNDWKSPKYNLNAVSTIDLMQTATLLPNGTVLRGFGNFKGNISGEGEKYHLEGEITSESLAASNVRLKALKVGAVIDGEGSIYDANGKAIADMLTFDDFQIDFPQLIGNVRGSGTDFKWVGELQAASLKSPNFTLASLFLSDAVAEYKDKELIASLGTVRARQFLTEDVAAQDLIARSIRISNIGDTTRVTAPNLRAGALTVDKDVKLRGLNASNIKVTDVPARTDVSASNLRADSLTTNDARLQNLNANGINLTRQTNGVTNIKANNLQAGQVDAGKAKLGNVVAGNITIRDQGKQTDVTSDTLKIAKVETDAAILGSLNVAGVRLSIRDGRVEATSNDINAGNVTLTKSALPEGGTIENVVARKPVFVLEKSGRYRASLDMSLGGGILGSVKLGAARAAVVATNDQVELNNLTADVMDGNVNGNAVIALNNRNTSRVDANFANLDLGKLLALQGGKVVPIAGKTNGQVNLSFTGTNIKNANGNLTADFAASAGTEARGLVPVNGRLGLRATNGLFDIDYANLNTEKSAVNATGRFDLNGDNSNLNIALNSTDASEIDRLIRVLNISPELEAQLDSTQATFAGNLVFNGNLTGNIQNPTVEGRASLDSIILRGRDIGSLATNISVTPSVIELRDGKLQQKDGGNIAFNVSVPQVGTNNISVQATINNINTGNLLAALPIELPEAIRDLNAQTSGTINLTGLPKAMSGVAEIKSTGGSVAGQSFDIDSRVTFAGTLVNVERFNATFGDGFLRAKGNYNSDSTVFDADVEGKNLQIARLIPLFSKSTDLPAIAGKVDVTAKATGRALEFSTYNINFNGVGQDIAFNNTALGSVNFSGNTVNQVLNTNLAINLGGQQQTIAATLNFGNENLPFRAETVFNQTDLAPYLALVETPDNVTITGRATGRILIEGNLYGKDAGGNGAFTANNLKGSARFSELGVLINDTPFSATDPFSITFNTNQITADRAVFTGGGSNVTVGGVIGLNDSVASNLTVDGKVNLRIFDILSKDAFFGGLADVSVRLIGVGTNARLTGSAALENSSFSTFVGSERINFSRINGRILFTSNQVQIDSLSGYLGGGKVNIDGGAVLSGLQLERFRFDVKGQNATAPLIDGLLATADLSIEATGYRENNNFNTLISGDVVVRRGVYSKDIDLADIIGNRRAGSISSGSSGGGSSILGVPKLDLRIEGRDSLIVRNNIADVRASASLRVSGDFETPIISGRITANEGTITFRNDRYDIQRGVLEFPPQSDSEPIINLQAETEISGYQIIVNLNGSLTNTETLNATVRSNPALPQADVVSLITTGSLANTDTGIPTLAQTGINTAAEVITDSLINEPLRKATDKLFGLNRFEIDPAIAGRGLNPSARLTVGRQINRNLAVTYSTNLSENQNQVLALEYRVSNKISFVAQYEQRPLGNVTRNNNVFSFEVRLKKRF